MDKNDLDRSYRGSHNQDSSVEIVNQFGVAKQLSKLDLSDSGSPGQKVASQSPGPAPVPRKRTYSLTPKSPQEDLKIQATRLEAVTRERNSLKSQLVAAEDRITSLELELESREQESHSGSRVETDGGGLQLEYDRQTSELSELKLELSFKCSEVDSLNKQTLHLTKEISEMKLKTIESSLTSSPSGGGRPVKRIELRLNEALQQLKQSEIENSRLREELSAHSTTADRLKHSEQQLLRVVAERDQLSQQNTSLQQQIAHDVEVKGQQLTKQLEDSRKQLKELQLEHARLAESKRQLEASNSGLEEGLEEARLDYKRLEQSSEVTQEEQVATIEQLTEGMASLKEQLLNSQHQHRQLQEDYEQLENEKEELFGQANDLEKTIRQLKGERQQDTMAMAETLEAIKQEAGQTMGDYSEVIVKLSEVENERDQFRMKHEQVLNILATRTQELRECQANTITRLEEQAKQADEAQEIMAAQMATYKEDFTEERKAREGMAAEGARLREVLDERVKEIEALRRQLNEQARDNLHHHFDDTPPMRAGGYHGNGQPY